MASLFVSYSRKDIESARKLTEAFKDQELDFWIDWEGIPPTVDWWNEIKKGIEEADVFLFLISPDSAKSKICRQEIEHAAKNGKRLIPIVVRDIKADESPAELGHLNWIFLRETDDFNLAFGKLITAIKTDYKWVQTHRQLQVKALEWDRTNKENSFLLRGKELQDAELQLTTNASKEPPPTDLQSEYVQKSRSATDRQRRSTMGIGIVGVVALVALTLFGYFKAGLATKNANSARAEELVVLAISEKASHFEVALLLGVEGVHTQKNFRTQRTLLSLMNENNRLLSYLSGYSDAVFSVTFSPNGKTLASGSCGNNDNGNCIQGEIILWDLSNPSKSTKLSTLLGHNREIWNVAFNPDSKTLASGSLDNTINLWDVSNPSNPAKLSTLSGFSVAFSPNGKTLASGSCGNNNNDNCIQGEIILWDVSNPSNPTKLSTLSGHNGNILSVAFSPDDKYLASGSDDKTIILWDVSNPSNPTKLSVLVTHHDIVFKVIFDPDSKYLVSSGSPDDKFIILWDVRNPRIPTELSTLSGFSAAFSPDDSTLASGSADTIILWDINHLNNPTKLITLSGHDGNVWSIAFSQDGKYLASAGDDESVVLWDVSNPKGRFDLFTLSSDNDFSSNVAFSPDSKYLASGSANTAILWDVSIPSNPLKLSDLSGHHDIVTSIAFSSNGKYLASGSYDKTIILWDLSNPNNSSQPKILLKHNYPVFSVAFSPNSDLLASGSGNTVILWNISNPSDPTQLSTTPVDDDNAVMSLAFSPDGKRLASGFGDTIILWNLNNPNDPLKLSALTAYHISSIAFSPDGRYLASMSYDYTFTLWGVNNPSNPTKLSTLSGPDTIYIAPSIAFNPLDGGQTLASGFSSGGGITLWDLSNPKSVQRIYSFSGNHTSSVSSVAFSPNGKYLASGSANAIVLWDVNPQSWVEKTCQRAGRNFTQAEWEKYFPNEEYRITCQQSPAGE